MRQENHIDLLHLELHYYSSVSLIYQQLTLCINTLYNGLLHFSVWEYKMHHLQQILKKD